MQWEQVIESGVGVIKRLCTQPLLVKDDETVWNRRSTKEHNVSCKKQIIQIKDSNRELNKNWAPQYSG